ncbi:transport SEC31 homolog B [Olea europaea subsp. europaea]|uniref:Transport SEC31 homolog B n=1 Tax=Olea europaea subsp. europaea TaxID=158383 RepID=A0A8S0S550_OLEEU|nr:transport SEC31 homolog B [Olea europaea subsp. europaea]
MYQLLKVKFYFCPGIARFSIYWPPLHLMEQPFSVIPVVWDLKKQKPVISFSDSIKRSCSVLQWNPEVATQLIVASDEDSSPSLKLWDMRNIMSPVKEFVGHTKALKLSQIGYIFS